MDVREWVEALRNECASGEQIRSLGSDVWTRDLSSEEEQILAAAANGGCVSLECAVAGEFPRISVDGRPVSESRDDYALSQLWVALTSLAGRGVLVPLGANRFTFDDVARNRGCRLRVRKLSDAS